MKTAAPSALSLALLGAASAFAPAPRGAAPSFLGAKSKSKNKKRKPRYFEGEGVSVQEREAVSGSGVNGDSPPGPRGQFGDVKSTIYGASYDAAVAERRAPRKSTALPFRNAPAALDGSLAGDFGFDPLGFAGNAADLAQQREAEVKHGRLAMLAAAGWPLSELWDRGLAKTLGMDPLLDDAGRVPSVLNGGMGRVSLGYWAGCLALAAAVEAYSSFAMKKGEGYVPGQLGFDPLGFYPKGQSAKDAKDRANLELSEVKHGRLAMVAITAFALQEFVSGTPVVEHAFAFFHPVWTSLGDQAPSYYVPPEAAEGLSTALQEAASSTVSTVQEAAGAAPQVMQAATDAVDAAAASAPASVPAAEASGSLQQEIADANARIADLEGKLAEIEALTR